jgi:enoyl-CoA hydratase
MLFLGEPLSADDAMRIGLVNWAVPAAELHSFVLDLAVTLAQRPAYALESAKFLVNKATDVDLRTGKEFELYVARKMASAEQRKAARSEAATSGGAYEKIFEERG